jgi:hypothetical protein
VYTILAPYSSSYTLSSSFTRLKIFIFILIKFYFLFVIILGIMKSYGLVCPSWSSELLQTQCKGDRCKMEAGCQAFILVSVNLWTQVEESALLTKAISKHVLCQLSPSSAHPKGLNFLPHSPTSKGSTNSQ